MTSFPFVGNSKRANFMFCCQFSDDELSKHFFVVHYKLSSLSYFRFVNFRLPIVTWTWYSRFDICNFITRSRPSFRIFYFNLSRCFWTWGESSLSFLPSFSSFSDCHFQFMIISVKNLSIIPTRVERETLSEYVMKYKKDVLLRAVSKKSSCRE